MSATLPITVMRTGKPIGREAIVFEAGVFHGEQAREVADAIFRACEPEAVQRLAAMLLDLSFDDDDPDEAVELLERACPMHFRTIARKMWASAIGGMATGNLRDELTCGLDSDTYEALAKAIVHDKNEDEKNVDYGFIWNTAKTLLEDGRYGEADDAIHDFVIEYAHRHHWKVIDEDGTEFANTEK